LKYQLLAYLFGFVFALQNQSNFHPVSAHNASANPCKIGCFFEVFLHDAGLADNHTYFLIDIAPCFRCNHGVALFHGPENSSSFFRKKPTQFIAHAPFTDHLSGDFGGSSISFPAPAVTDQTVSPQPGCPAIGPALIPDNLRIIMLSSIGSRSHAQSSGAGDNCNFMHRIGIR
jgi:hypothetical protein